MKETALLQQHKDLNAKLTPFAGYNMPLEYSGVIDEHMAVRQAAGIFDVSHMGEFWVKGEGAFALLQKITTNDLSKLTVGKAQYTCMPNGKGGIVDDLIIYKFEESKYMAVVNAANLTKDWEWFNKHNEFGAELEDASDSMSLIALQGPKAEEILQKVSSVNLVAIDSFSFVVGDVASAGEVIISATGYTGAGGFELYCYNNDAGVIWDALMESGEPLGLKPTGLAARDTLRLEKGYCLYGNDIDDTTSPLEAGLGWIVKFSEGNNFIDRAVLQKQKTDGVDRKLVGVELIGRGIPRKDYKIVDAEDAEIGVFTSGTMSPVLKKGIGMAYVKTTMSKTGTTVFVQVRNKKIEAKVVKLPFV